jgi:hypothetical protein
MANRKSKKKSPAPFEVAKAESSQLTLFIPSGDRFENPIDQEKLERSALVMLGTFYAGGTALPKGHGVWRDDEQGGKLVFDETILIHCYTNRRTLEENKARLHEFLVTMGTETNQGAVGFVIDGVYMEIRFPLKTQERDHG